MEDHDKTREQLIAELHELRLQLAESKKVEAKEKQASKEQMELETRFGLSFNSLRDGLLLVDHETRRFLAGNRAIQEMLGYSAEELVQIGMADIHPAEDFPWVIDRFEGLTRKEIEVARNIPVRRKDGSVFYADVGASFPMVLDDRECLLGVFRDVTERKQAEDALLESEERHRHISEMISDYAFSCVKPSGGGFSIDWLVGAVEKISGYAADEVRSHGCWKFLVHPSDIPVFERQVVGLAPGDTGECELRIVHKNGSIRWIRVVSKVINDSENPLSHRLFGSCEDITGRKQAEKALQQSEQEKAILNQISNVFLTTPDERIYEEVLAVILKALQCRHGIFGYVGDSGELVIPSLTKEIWSECRVEGKSIVFPRHQWGDSLWGMAITEKKPFYSEGPFHTPEGHLSVHNFLTVPVVFADRTIGLVSLANKDRGFTVEDRAVLKRIAGSISPILNTRLQRDSQELERKRAEDALQATTAELQLIFDNMINAFVVWESVFDENGRYVGFRFGRFNEAFARIAKLKCEEVRGKDVFEVWPATEQSWVEVYGDVAVSGIPRVFDMYHEPTRGWYHCHAYRPSESPSQICVIFEDITERRRQEEERKRLEERLHRAEKMEALGTMAGGVAHDLNNVLGILVGYSELLLYEVDETSSTLRSYARAIQEGGAQAAAIVQDLLTLTRRGVPSRQILNLNSIVMDCQASPEVAGILAHHPNTGIKVDLEVDLLNISGSSVHLRKTLINLLINAVEAMHNGGLITVKTRNQYLDGPISGYDEVKEGDYVVLTVSDTGEGIPGTDLQRIFEPFYTRKVMGRSGTGLGLAVVWGTVKDHFGYINVESEENNGTMFSLYFPVTREEIAPEQIALSASDYLGKGESILVVDDVKEQRELATMMLTKLNYTVASVPSGEEAVKTMQEHSFDLIVLDMIMDPGMDGLDTYLKIQEIHPYQKSIIVSGFSETERVAKAQALGAGAYVKKPYELKRLGLAIRKELDRTGF